ncbi:MAG: type III-B CRISPR module-associated protein Cmr5 [Acidobacteriota bacterium]|nr:type III-B CRISPR module-associated protein Cmr5 [Acidobacteriota bacterium]
MITRSQRFSRLVYEKVSKHVSEAKANRDKYITMAQKLPVLIQTAGLAQAIAFLEAKSQGESEKMNRCLLEDLSSVLGFNSVEEFSKKCREAELTEYLWLTQNALSALLWFKRFSVSVLEVEENAE